MRLLARDDEGRKLATQLVVHAACPVEVFEEEVAPAPPLAGAEVDADTEGRAIGDAQRLLRGTRAVVARSCVDLSPPIPALSNA